MCTEVGENNESHLHMNGCQATGMSDCDMSGSKSAAAAEEKKNGIESTEVVSDNASVPSDLASMDQEVILIQDTGFTIKIAAPGTEPFDLQVIFSHHIFSCC